MQMSTWEPFWKGKKCKANLQLLTMSETFMRQTKMIYPLLKFLFIYYTINAILTPYKEDEVRWTVSIRHLDLERIQYTNTWEMHITKQHEVRDKGYKTDGNFVTYVFHILVQCYLASRSPSSQNIMLYTHH